jgi:glycosyltransferase involved in cell wall biosynthesis
MRITFITGEYPPQPGGVGDYSQCLAQALVARGEHVSVLTVQQGQLWLIDAGNDSRQALAPLAQWDWRSRGVVAQALAAQQPDIVSIQYQTGAYAMHPAINLLPRYLRKHLPNARIVTTAHDLLLPYLFPKAGPVRNWVTKRLLADSHGAITTNPVDYAKAQEYAPAVQHAYIPIGSNIELAPPAGYQRSAWRNKLGIAPDDVLIAYFGLISHTKGVHTILQALKQVPANYHLLIIGGEATQAQDREYAASIRQQIAEQGLGQRVTITGHAEAQDVSAHLLAADLAALPFTDGASFRRGSLLAALAHGLPLVTTTPQANALPPNNTAAHLQNDQNCLLVAPEQSEQLVKALQQLAESPELRERLSAGAKALAANFSWPNIAEQHQIFFASLTK